MKYVVSIDETGEFLIRYVWRVLYPAVDPLFPNVVVSLDKGAAITYRGAERAAERAIRKHQKQLALSGVTYTREL